MTVAPDSPLAIGGLRLDRRVMMAPMAGVTTSAFRRSARRWGAGLLFTEMISSYGIAYGNRRTLDYLVCGPDEHPIGFQLFGADPAKLALAAEACVAAGADLIDINMACPVRKVVKTGAGAALLGDPALAAAIVRAVRAATPDHIPVTAKIRSGLRSGHEGWRSVGPQLVEAGAAAVCIHPRTASQLYRGTADHGITFALAALLPVPVIASGDVTSRAVCLELLEGGAAAVMAARAALGRPWFFAELLDDDPPDQTARFKELALFVEEALVAMGSRGVGYLRQFWPRFRAAGVIDREAARILMGAQDAAELRASLAALGAFYTGVAKGL